MSVMAIVMAIVMMVAIVIVVAVTGFVVVRRYRGTNAGASSRTDDGAFPPAELVTDCAADGAADTATDRCVHCLVSERS
jgi:hypothetical protein